MRGPTASQRESAEPGVDAFYLAVRRGPRMALPARLPHDRQRDGAGSTVATAGHWRTLADEARSLRRTERWRGGRSRRLLAAPGISAGVLVFA